MSGNGIFDDLENALLAYHNKDNGFIIKLADIMDALEFQMAKNIHADIEPTERLKNFCNELLGYHFGMAFTTKCAINLINMLFQKQIEYHGMYVIAANELINSEDFIDRNNYFNSAYISEIPSREYLPNLVRCKSIWEEVIKPLDNKLDILIFPYPW